MPSLAASVAIRIDVLVLGERLLGLAAFLAAHSAVDRDDRFGLPRSVRIRSTR